MYVRAEKSVREQAKSEQTVLFGFVPFSFHFRSIFVPFSFAHVRFCSNFVRFCSGIGRVARRRAQRGARRASVFSMGECRGNGVALILEAQGTGEHPLKRCGRGRGRAGDRSLGGSPGRWSREGASRDGALTVTASQGKGLQPQLRLAVLGGRSLEGCRRVWGLGAQRASVTRRSGAPQTPCAKWRLTHHHHGTHRDRLARYDTLSARRTGACTVLESAGRQRREQGQGEGAAKDTVSLRVDRTQAHTPPATLHPTHRHALMHWRWSKP